MTDLFKVYHAKGIVDFSPYAVTGVETFIKDGEEFGFMSAYVVERDENGDLAPREVNTLSRINGEDDEWIRLTGYYDRRIASTVTWAAMDVFRALDAGSAVYRYMLRWEDGERIVSYLVKDHIDLADLVNRLKVLGEVLK